MPLLHLGTDLSRMGPDSILGPMVQVQRSTVPILQGRPHSHVGKAILVQIGKGAHGKAKPSILGGFRLQCPLECQQGLLAARRREQMLSCQAQPVSRPASVRASLLLSLRPTHEGTPASLTWPTRYTYTRPVSLFWGPRNMGAATSKTSVVPSRSVSSGQSSLPKYEPIWGVGGGRGAVTPEERGGDCGQVEGSHQPVDPALMPPTDSANQTRHRLLRPLSCPFILFPHRLDFPVIQRSHEPLGALPALPGGSGRPSQPRLS